MDSIISWAGVLGQMKRRTFRPELNIIIHHSASWLQQTGAAPCSSHHGLPAMIDSVFKLQANMNPCLLNCFSWLFYCSDKKRYSSKNIDPYHSKASSSWEPRPETWQRGIENMTLRIQTIAVNAFKAVRE